MNESQGDDGTARNSDESVIKNVNNFSKMNQKIGPTMIKAWIYVQTKLNTFLSKLCLYEETRRYLFLDTYKAKMNHILRATPDISLFNDDEIPPHLRDVGILSGYRSPTSSIKDCALSVFFATNETVNFWTHFLPPFYFLYQLIIYWDTLKIVSDSYYWPFVVYMLTICIYPLLSALAHIFCSTSDMARHVWFFLDYGGLTLYAYGVGVLIKAYAFPEELLPTIIGKYFLEVLVFLCIACSILACFSRFVDSLFWIKVFRLGAFALPWIWDNIPLVYRIMWSSDLDPSAAQNYNLQFFFSFCIAFFYASHLPERLAPGKFDFVGNSHQLLHVSGIMATHHQMTAAMIDMGNRGRLVQEKHPFPEYWAVQVFSLVSFSVALTIVVFILWARHYEKNRENVKRDC